MCLLYAKLQLRGKYIDMWNINRSIVKKKTKKKTPKKPNYTGIKKYMQMRELLYGITNFNSKVFLLEFAK